MTAPGQIVSVWVYDIKKEKNEKEFGQTSIFN